VSPIDRSNVIDRSKISRERKKNRKELQQNGDQFDHYGTEGIFFDGRKDQTLTQVLGGFWIFKSEFLLFHVKLCKFI